jgi:CBS domain containing-hemolysin-like protein
MIWVSFGLVLFLALISIVLACVEASYYLIRRRRLGHLAHENPHAELANRYLDDPATLLMPIHLGTYMCHVVMTALITVALLDTLNRWALAVALGVMVLYLLLFRLTLPYALVRRDPERALLLLLPGFHLYARLLAPLVDVLKQRADPDAAEEEETPAAGTAPEVPPPPALDEDEARIEDSLMRFSELLVRDVMTPRPDVVAIEGTASIEDLRRVMRETKFSRLPVFGDNLDDIVGVVNVHDLTDHQGDGKDNLRVLMRPALLVPETKKAADLLKEFQTKRTTFAIAIDEYGGTAGVVSVEDIVEELVGEIKDEYDVEAEPMVAEPDGAFLVSGKLSLDRLEQALEASMADGTDVATVGGLVTTLFGRIPRTGERIDHRGFTLEVVAAERKRVNRVRVRRRPEAGIA